MIVRSIFPVPAARDFTLVAAVALVLVRLHSGAEMASD